MLVCFRGGLEENVKDPETKIKCNELNTISPTIRDVIVHIEKNHLLNNYEFFSVKGELEGGILCVINGVDWELLEGYSAVVKDTDTIYFISTMHGG
ncbi:ubiquitin related modifier 1 [Nematocida sp. LUAm3]|nr:ubiquitin related modifier 1 [Nematocida sp. LUAm3]KAI5175963.1 ubiquitin related modifier 1 [Nematocida sp. LUAm2]KAI5179059.1 ubiquitin related modifier 1 [Nematocida sp. LUAm1]